MIRIREAIQAGAQTVVAECPFCIKMLEQSAQSAVAGSEVRIKDIAEIVAEALDEEDVAAQRASDNQQYHDQMKEPL